MWPIATGTGKQESSAHFVQIAWEVIILTKCSALVPDLLRDWLVSLIHQVPFGIVDNFNLDLG